LKLVYKARDIIEAQIISGLLKSKGIKSFVGGYYLQGGIGELAAMDFASVSVADEDVESSVAIIAEYDKGRNIDSVKKQNKNIFMAPLMVLAISIIVMLLLAISFSNG